MKLIELEQCCDTRMEREIRELLLGKPELTTEQVWALVEPLHRLRRAPYGTCCALIDGTRESRARWATGLYVVEQGALVCLSCDWDSSG